MPDYPSEAGFARTELAIRLHEVSKIYRLHGSQRDQLIDVLGLQRFGVRTRTKPQEFAALSDVSIDVPRGQRIGIVGRNGAGKTTLLKLICGNFAPTSGEIEVRGTVQALMNIGLGFHPEYTGRENVEASLQYNGLSKAEYQEAMESIIDFCELGQFLDQPFKTYSLGMQARLMFAAATAIRPDILIVDEVLGAGDAYFVAKSKQRVEKLVRSGCTMLLVSHSMSQVLELCDEAIWLDRGRVRMSGEAFRVVKAYEEYLHGPIAQVSNPADPPALMQPVKSLAKPEAERDQTASDLPRDFGDRLQEPRFVPHGELPSFPVLAPPNELRFQAQGGLSRWASEKGVKICGFTLLTTRGESNQLVAMQPAKILINLVAEVGAALSIRAGVVLFDLLGNCVLKIISPVQHLDLAVGQAHCLEMLLNPVQLGPGEYVLSLSLHAEGPLELFNSTPRYDLLNRSFSLRISMPESIEHLSAGFFHTAEWAEYATSEQPAQPISAVG